MSSPKIVDAAGLRRLHRPVVFTNGVFDILHAGHVDYLRNAKSLGVNLVVAVNTDDSVRRLGKGADRPINTEFDRMEVLAALECVDRVTWFHEDTPEELIRRVRPDILVKGGDYDPATIAGADFVRANGGRVRCIPIKHHLSTTALIERIRGANPR